MHEKAEHIIKGASALSYSIGGALAIGDWLSFIDNHSWVVGAFLGLLTYATNVIFQIINTRAIKAQNTKLSETK